MKKLTTRLSLALITLLVAVEGYAGITYPLPPSIQPLAERLQEMKRGIQFKPQLSQRCLAVKVIDKMIKGYHQRSFNLTFDFQQDGSIAKVKLERKHGWENSNIPAIEFSVEDFAINYGWMVVTKDGWELQAFSHRHTDNHATITFGLNIYRPLTDDGFWGDMTKIHLVVFEQNADGEERVYQSKNSDVVTCRRW